MLKDCKTCERGPFEPDLLSEGGRCGWCLLEDKRGEAEVEHKARLKDNSWQGPQGDAVRLERNQLLEVWAWTVRPGSPLSEACQSEFVTFFEKLHRLTVDYKNPKAVKMPEPPVLTYKE